MHGVRALAAAVSLAHAGLLAGVFFSTSIKTHVFVSTELSGLLFFRVCNTCFVLLELLSAAYYLHAGLQGSQWLYAALSAALAAAVGWVLLVCSPVDQAAHMGGAGVFIAGTVGYSVPLFMQAGGWLRVALYALGGGGVVAALVYVALYFAGLYGEAAAAEWAAFMTHAVLLLSFFSANDPEPKEEGKAKGQRGGREREWLLKPQG